MIPFLAEWGLEILFSVISALVLGFFTYQAAQLREKKSQYRELIKEQEAQKAEIALDTKLEPIYQELEELRTYVLSSLRLPLQQFLSRRQQASRLLPASLTRKRQLRSPRSRLERSLKLRPSPPFSDTIYVLVDGLR